MSTVKIIIFTQINTTRKNKIFSLQKSEQIAKKSIVLYLYLIFAYFWCFNRLLMTNIHDDDGLDDNI